MKKDINNKTKPFISKVDVFVITTVFCVFLAGIVLVKAVLQKETFVNIELLATGGEWWWGVPPPYYWNSDTLNIGSKELDVSKKPLVEILDKETYDHEERKFIWIKARLKTTKNMRTGQLYFKQFPLNIGETITIKPNNTMIIGNVVAIEGTKQYRNQSERIITAKLLLKMPWVVDGIKVGDVMKDSNGETVAEILDKKTEKALVVTTDWRGEPLAKRDPFQFDITLRIKIRVLEGGNFAYFSYYQLIQPEQRLKIQLQNITIEPTILSVEKP